MLYERFAAHRQPAIDARAERAPCVQPRKHRKERKHDEQRNIQRQQPRKRRLPPRKRNADITRVAAARENEGVPPCKNERITLRRDVKQHSFVRTYADDPAAAHAVKGTLRTQHGIERLPDAQGVFRLKSIVETVKIARQIHARKSRFRFTESGELLRGDIVLFVTVFHAVRREPADGIYIRGNVNVTVFRHTDPLHARFDAARTDGVFAAVQFRIFAIAYGCGGRTAEIGAEQVYFLPRTDYTVYREQVARCGEICLLRHIVRFQRPGRHAAAIRGKTQHLPVAV